jgi:amidophosphoribosyltransferase
MNECLFDLIYMQHEEQLFNGMSIASFRTYLGSLLAKERPQKGDIVVPVPETANYIAQGYAQNSNISLSLGIFKRRPKPQTLFVDNRPVLLDDVFHIVPDLLEGRNIILIDEAVISGLTLKTIVSKMRNINVKSISVRVIGVMKAPCKFKYNNRVGKNICDTDNYAEYFGVDSFESLPLEISSRYASCAACFRS